MLSGADIYAKLDLKAITFAKLDAARKTLQARGEAETRHDRSAARSVEHLHRPARRPQRLAIARNLDGELRKLLDRARKSPI